MFIRCIKSWLRCYVRKFLDVVRFKPGFMYNFRNYVADHNMGLCWHEIYKNQKTKLTQY